MDGFAGARTRPVGDSECRHRQRRSDRCRRDQRDRRRLADSGSNVNDNKALVILVGRRRARRGSNPLAASLAGDRPMYAAARDRARRQPRMYLTYEADTAPLEGRGHDLAAALPTVSS